MGIYPLVIHKLHSHSLTEPQSEEHPFHFCRLSIAGKQCSLNLILLLLLVCDFSSSFIPRSSLSGHSATFCPSWLPSTPHDKLARFTILVSLNLISPPSSAKGIQAVASQQQKLHSQRVLANGLSLLFWTTWHMLCHWCDSPCCLLLTKVQLLAKLPPLLLLAIARVFGSDKLHYSSLIYRIKWIMAMAWWLTLLECYHIQV